MHAPPADILEQMGLPLSGWAEPANPGIVAKTWIHQNLVLQSRPIQLLDRLIMLHDLSTSVEIEGLGFFAPPMIEKRGQGLVAAMPGAGGDKVWTLQPRLQEIRPFYISGMDSQDLIAASAQALPGIIDQLQLFASQAQHAQLLCAHDTPGVSIQKADPETLRQLARRKCPLPFSPADLLPEYEPRSPLVPSHGDSILKNTLLTPDGVRLIDWEAASVLPRHMDLTHFSAFVCKYSEPRHWNRLIAEHWEIVQGQLSGWDLEAWRLSVAWYLIREMIAFSPKSPEQCLRCWTGLRDLAESF